MHRYFETPFQHAYFAEGSEIVEVKPRLNIAKVGDKVKIKEFGKGLVQWVGCLDDSRGWIKLNYIALCFVCFDCCDCF